MSQHPYQRDYPSPYPVVTVGCPVCLQPITVEYDPGEPTTWDYPGSPPEWYITLASTAEHTCDHVLTGPMWERVQEAATNTPEYRAYEYTESQV